MQKSPAASAGGEEYASLTPKNAAFVEALVDHMVLADEAAGNGTEIGPNLYIDTALGGNWGNGDHLHMHRPREANAPRQPDVSWAALYRLGIAATNVYCKRTFGELFDQISDSKQKGVLRLLDSIKLVFQDGSYAGGFFAIVYQTTMKAKRPDAMCRRFVRCYRSSMLNVL